MKKLLLTLIILFIASVNAKYVFACTMRPHSIQINDSNSNCDIYPEFWYSKLNINQVNESNINQICPGFNLFEKDKQIIFEFVSKLKSSYGYTHIKRQTDLEYSSFLSEIKRVNSDICNCGKIVLEGRNGNWTAYTDRFKESCSFSTACYQPPFYCPSSAYFTMYFIPLFILLIIIFGIITVVFLIKKHKKKKH